MDLGATICTPAPRPAASAPGVGPAAPAAPASPPTCPAGRAKPAKPVRHGTAYLALRDDGAVLVEPRPARGLLGGMLGLPGPPGPRPRPPAAPPFPADWRRLGEVRHTFTHFHLVLRHRGRAGREGRRATSIPVAGLGAALPSVMRKALRLGLASFASGRPS